MQLTAFAALSLAAWSACDVDRAILQIPATPVPDAATPGPGGDAANADGDYRSLGSPLNPSGGYPDGGSEVGVDPPSSASVSASTTVVSCRTARLGELATVGEVETKLLKPSCGTEAACHTTTNKFTFPPDMQAPDIFERLVDVKSGYPGRCKDLEIVYIDPRNPLGSFFVSKVQDPAPTCEGERGGARMPFAKPKPLPDDEIDCIAAYALAVSGR